VDSYDEWEEEGEYEDEWAGEDEEVGNDMTFKDLEDSGMDKVIESIGSPDAETNPYQPGESYTNGDAYSLTSSKIDQKSNDDWYDDETGLTIPIFIVVIVGLLAFAFLKNRTTPSNSMRSGYRPVPGGHRKNY
jgi:hypothetical protein